MQHIDLHPKYVSSRDLGGQDTRGGIHWCEARGELFPHLLLSNLYSYTCREEDQVGALQHEGLICGLKRDFKSLQGLYPRLEDDSSEQKCKL